jgi:hypothetical protein
MFNDFNHDIIFVISNDLLNIRFTAIMESRERTSSDSSEAFTPVPVGETFKFRESISP